MKTQVMENRHNLANFVPKTCSEVVNAVVAEPVGQEPAASVSVGSQPGGASAPSTEDWPGKYGFSIAFKDKGAQNGKLHSWLWSEELQKLFVEMNKPCPFDVRANNFQEQLFVRALPLYTTATNVLRVVKRCPNHASPEDPTNIDVPEALRPHLIRAECGSAVYDEDTESKRLSVRLPLGRPEPGANWTTLLFKFMCLGSCVGGINRRALQVIFTLETVSGEVVGRQCIGVRICACPSRDRKVEERKFEMNANGELPTGIPTGPHQLLPPLSRKRSGSVNSNPSLSASASQNFLNSLKPKPKTENGSLNEENVYTIKVHCYANYILLKEIAYALEVKSHASELYPHLMDDIMPLMGDSAIDKFDPEFMCADRETGVMGGFGTCKMNSVSRPPNLCMTIPSSAPSSNPASGCVSPDAEISPPFPPPQSQQQHQQQQLSNAAKMAQENERKQLKRSLSHCTSLPANVRVTTSAGVSAVAAPVHVKRLCAVGRAEVEANSGQLVLITTTSASSSCSASAASPPPPQSSSSSASSLSVTMEGGSQGTKPSDGLYMLAEQADRLARDPSVSGCSSRRASPECEVVRIRASSMSASDFKYRERFSIFNPSFKSCQVQTESKGTGTDPLCNKLAAINRKPLSPPLIVARYQPVQQQQPPPQVQQQQQQSQAQPQQVQVQKLQQQPPALHQRAASSVCADSGRASSPSSSGSSCLAVASAGFGKPFGGGSCSSSSDTQTMKDFLESLGMGDVWTNCLESAGEYHNWVAARFAWWSEDDFESLGVEKRVSQYLVSKLAKFKQNLSSERALIASCSGN